VSGISVEFYSCFIRVKVIIIAKSLLGDLATYRNLSLPWPSRQYQQNQQIGTSELLERISTEDEEVAPE
jgi:hypothetical protein